MGAGGLKNITVKTAIEGGTGSIKWQAAPARKLYFTFNKSIYDKMGVVGTTLERRITYYPGCYSWVKIVTSRAPHESKTYSSLIIEHVKWPYNKMYTMSVSDVQAMSDVMNILGHSTWYTTEWIRDHYRCGLTDVYVDHAPGLPPYIEVYARNGNDICSVEKALGLINEPEMDLAEYYNCFYGIPTTITIRRRTFETARVEIGAYITRSQAGFNTILSQQKATLRELGLAEE